MALDFVWQNSCSSSAVYYASMFISQSTQDLHLPQCTPASSPPCIPLPQFCDQPLNPKHDRDHNTLYVLTRPQLASSPTRRAPTPRTSVSRWLCPSGGCIGIIEGFIGIYMGYTGVMETIQGIGHTPPHDPPTP